MNHNFGLDFKKKEKKKGGGKDMCCAVFYGFINEVIKHDLWNSINEKNHISL